MTAISVFQEKSKCVLYQTYSQYFSICMIVCTTTKPLNEEAFSTSDHDKMRTDPESGGSQYHVKRNTVSPHPGKNIERDEKPCDKHNNHWASV